MVVIHIQEAMLILFCFSFPIDFLISSTPEERKEVKEEEKNTKT